MKAYFFDRSNPFSIIGFLFTFKPVCKKTSILEGAAMWVLPFFVKNVFSMKRNSHMSAAALITSVVALVNISEPLIPKKHLQSYPKIINYLPKKFANDQAAAGMDIKILPYIQTAHMTPIKYAHHLSVKSLQSRRRQWPINSYRRFYRRCRSIRLSQPLGIFGYAPTSRRDQHCL